MAARMRLRRSMMSCSDLDRFNSHMAHGHPVPSGKHLSSKQIRRYRPLKSESSMSILMRPVDSCERTPSSSVDEFSKFRPSADTIRRIVPPSSVTVPDEVSPHPSLEHASLHSIFGTAPGNITLRPVYSHRHPAPEPHRPWGNHDLLEEHPRGTKSTIRSIDLPAEPTASTSMDLNHLQAPMSGTKMRAVQQAKEMQDLVAERAKRSGDEPPPYEFFELIGKGAYGRVFKGTNRSTGSLVAIKILDIDKVDYEEMTTKNLSETLKEINILQQLRDSKARPYVNMIEEARPVHNELWIVSEYASGGSVNTLMKPTMGNDQQGLEEKFIIPIARELALGLKYIHEAGVLHRDLKCNNILILEDGRVQLCDFGVSGMLEPEISKRSTIVGTPYWMAPELQKEWAKDADPHSRIEPNEILYGSEVDIWAYGCTIYEMATGFPPFHRTIQWDLPSTGVPVLEGDQYPEELKDFVAFILQPNPQDRPTPDEILQHPYLLNSAKVYPTVMLVKLVEEYYKWERGGGIRASLFNPYGAQAPDPLAPEEDDNDDDWTFSTSDEFENRLSRAFPETFTAMPLDLDAPPEEEDRFAKLQATFKEQSIDRGGQRLNRLFDQTQKPYRFSGIDSGSGRPPSDLILRDFNPGAPNRETVIDLDFAAPTTVEVPSIDLGEVPTVRANRMQKIIREMQMEDEEHDAFDQDELTKRATRDWRFPARPDEPNRKTQDWKFPATEANRQTREFQFPPKPNRVTREWTFDAAMAEANYQAQRNSRRETKDWKFPSQPTAEEGERKARDTRDWKFPLEVPPPSEPGGNARDTMAWTFPTMDSAPPASSRKTQDFKFPMQNPSESEESSSEFEPSASSSPTNGPDFRPALRHANTEPMNMLNNDFPIISSAPDSPLKIDLDLAVVDQRRPSTSGSTSTTLRTKTSQHLHDNPFNLEDQVQLSQANDRASFHTKSQSEPNQALPGLLTPQPYNEHEQPAAHDAHHANMHARGLSSISQVSSHLKPPSSNGTSISSMNRAHPRAQNSLWDGWSHTTAYDMSASSSPPASVATDASADDYDIDELWDNLERMTTATTAASSASSKNRYAYPKPSISTALRASPHSSDTDDAYLSSSSVPMSRVASASSTTADVGMMPSFAPYDDPLLPRLRVSLGPNGKPLVEFPMPRGPEPEALCGGLYATGETDAAADNGNGGNALANALWKSSVELRDGVRACRELLRAMRLEDVDVGTEQEGEEALASVSAAAADGLVPGQALGQGRGVMEEEEQGEGLTVRVGR